MARISAVEAFYNRALVHELRHGQNMSLRAICETTGFSLGSVQNYLSQPCPAQSPGAAIDRALLLRKLPNNKHRGALEIRAMVVAEGYEAVPSERTISAAMADAGLARKGVGRMSSRRPYHIDARPTQYLEMLQMDTVKIRPGKGKLVELLSVRDVASGCHMLIRHDATQAGMVRAISKIKAVFGGLPKVIQTDNGTTDFSMPRRNVLRPWHAYAFTHGTERVQFIPEAEPARNGSVESFHNWLKNEVDGDPAWADLTDDRLDDWLWDRLYYYNYRKPLGTTKAIPSSLAGGRFDLNGIGCSTDDAYSMNASGCVSFIRYVSRSVDRASGEVLTVAVVKSPGTVFVVPSEFEGGYLRFDCYTDGRGECWAPSPVDVQAAIQSGERRVNGRIAERGVSGRLVALFDSPLVVSRDAVFIHTADVDGFSPVVTDPASVIRVWKRVLKQAMPTLLPTGYELRSGEDGSWEVYRNGELVWTEQSSPDVIEHAAEVF